MATEREEQQGQDLVSVLDDLDDEMLLAAWLEGNGPTHRSPLEDYDWITSNLAVGGGSFSVERAVRDGVGLVIDNRLESPNGYARWQGTGIDYIWNGVPDDGEAEPNRYYEQARRVSDLMEADPELRVITHCAAGANRGPGVGYVVLRLQGMEPDEAHALLKAKRPVVWNDYREDAEMWLAGVPYQQRRERFRYMQAMAMGKRLARRLGHAPTIEETILACWYGGDDA